MTAAIGRVWKGLRLLSSRKEWSRHRIIFSDYQHCKGALRRLARGAPAGDPERRALFVSSFPTVFGLKLEGVLSLGARLAGLTPVIGPVDRNPWVGRYHRLFGNQLLFRFRSELAGHPDPALPPDVQELLASRPVVSDLMRLAYRGVDVGRVALSNVINRRKFSRFDLDDPEVLTEVRAELVRVRRNVHAAESFLERVRPQLLLLLEKGLSPAAEIVGVGLARGIPVIQYVGSQRSAAYVLKRFSYESRHQHPFSLDPQSWGRAKRMSWGPSQEARVMRDLEESYRSGTWFNRKFLHQGKRIKSAAEVRAQLGLDPAKKTAVIFSHVLWDATFFYGQGIFEDYESFLLETVRAACANPRLNWLVKLHPDLVWKLRYEGYTGELRDVMAMRSAVGSLPAHVKIVPPETDISTYSFFGVTDYCLTVRGTIGIEMACHGVPVLTAGSGRYSGLGFTIDSASAGEYLDRLARLESLPALSPAQRELSRRFAYVLFKLRPWTLESFEMTKMPIEMTGHPLDTNLVPRIETFAEFARAADTRRFAEWVASGEPDYLSADGESGVGSGEPSAMS
jgi:hypothetical protein